MDGKTAILILRIPTEKKQELRAEAQRAGVTLSAVVRDILAASDQGGEGKRNG